MTLARFFQIDFSKHTFPNAYFARKFRLRMCRNGISSVKITLK